MIPIAAAAGGAGEGIDWWGIAWLGVLLLVNAFFVGAEFAVVSARRSQIEPLVEAGSAAARTALWAMEHATLMLATSQLGITVCSLLILNVSEPAIHHLLEIPLDLTHLPAEVIGGIAFAITLVVVSFLHVVIGEMVPKNLSFSVPDRAVLILAPPLVAIARTLKPVIWSLNAIANGVLRLFRVEPKNEAASSFTAEEVQTIIATSTREGLLLDQSGALGNTFEFTEKLVRDVALPRESLVTLPRDASPADIERAVARHRFSRYILVDADGEPVGYVHIKDVLATDDESLDQPIAAKRVRELLPIYWKVSLEDALADMRSAEKHVARAFDEQGATRGVLFFEDAVEVLVGKVEDVTADSLKPDRGRPGFLSGVHPHLPPDDRQI